MSLLALISKRLFSATLTMVKDAERDKDIPVNKKLLSHFNYLALKSELAGYSEEITYLYKTRIHR